MRWLIDWWPGIAMLGWLYFIEGVAGWSAAAFSAVTALAVCFVAFWEAGGHKAALDEKEE